MGIPKCSKVAPEGFRGDPWDFKKFKDLRVFQGVVGIFQGISEGSMIVLKRCFRSISGSFRMVNDIQRVSIDFRKVPERWLQGRGRGFQGHFFNSTEIPSEAWKFSEKP